VGEMVAEALLGKKATPLRRWVSVACWR